MKFDPLSQNKIIKPNEIFFTRGSQSVVAEAAASTSPRDLWEMQRIRNSGGGSSNVCFDLPSKWFRRMLILRPAATDIATPVVISISDTGVTLELVTNTESQDARRHTVSECTR